MRNPFRPNQFLTSPYGVVGIILTQGQIALVDEETFNLVRHWRWYAAKHDRRWYAYSKTNSNKYIGKRRVAIAMHALICPDFTLTDHKNGNGLDNRRKNLRNATSSQNSFNIPKYAKLSGYHGVQKDKHGGWKFRIQRDGKRLTFGGFATAAEAYKSRLAKERELYPEFDRVER